MGNPFQTPAAAGFVFISDPTMAEALIRKHLWEQYLHDLEKRQQTKQRRR
jgi:hypothetical protein